MDEARTVTIRMFGLLRSLRSERGLESTIDMPLPTEGLSAREIALQLELPIDRIEGVFVNHTVRGLDHTVVPGDRIAFVPPGTPGPHRYCLGLHDAGKSSDAAQ